MNPLNGAVEVIILDLMNPLTLNLQVKWLYIINTNDPNSTQSHYESIARPRDARNLFIYYFIYFNKISSYRDIVLQCIYHMRIMLVIEGVLLVLVQIVHYILTRELYREAGKQGIVLIKLDLVI